MAVQTEGWLQNQNYCLLAVCLYQPVELQSRLLRVFCNKIEVVTILSSLRNHFYRILTEFHHIVLLQEQPMGLFWITAVIKVFFFLITTLIKYLSSREDVKTLSSNFFLRILTSQISDFKHKTGLFLNFNYNLKMTDLFYIFFFNSQF